KDLATFEKLENAFRLIEEALREQPSLKILQFDPMLRALADGLKVLSMKDSELDVADLMLKHEWFIGQRFYIRARVQDSSAPIFVVLPAQDIPEGVMISGHLQKAQLITGQVVGLVLEIRRKYHTPAWHIQKIDRLQERGLG